MALATAAGTPTTGGSPTPLAPKGPSGAGTSTISVVDRRDGVDGGHRVLDEGARAQLAVVVVGELLEERPAEALRDAAEQLAGDERGVQGAADVLGDDVVQQRHRAGLAIDADVGEVGGRARRAAGLRGAAVALDRRVGGCRS